MTCLSEDVRLARVIDLTGDRIGKTVVLRFARMSHGGPVWHLRCDCGDEFEARSDTLRGASESYRCHKCRPRAGRSIVRNCTSCGSPEHNRASCQKAKAEREERIRRGEERCRQCEGMPHRRPMRATKLCACGKSYAPEPPLTLDYVFALPRPAARTAVW